MINTNWLDVYDGRTGTHLRVSPEVLERLGREGVLQVALGLKARGLQAGAFRASQASGLFFTAGGLELFAGVVLLNGEAGRVPVYLITTRAQWEEHNVDRERRN